MEHKNCRTSIHHKCIVLKLFQNRTNLDTDTGMMVVSVGLDGVLDLHSGNAHLYTVVNLR